MGEGHRAGDREGKGDHSAKDFERRHLAGKIRVKPDVAREAGRMRASAVSGGGATARMRLPEGRGRWL